MDRGLFVLYLLYGFVYLSLGIRVLSFYLSDVRNNALIKAFRYIALFGILHGITEWMTMLQITRLYQEYNVLIFNVKYIIKALSFLALFQFAFEIFYKDLKWRFLRVIPMGIFLLYLGVFAIVIHQQGSEYFHENRNFNILFMRYFLALFGSVLSAFAMGYTLKKNPKESAARQRLYKYFIAAFLVYGVIDGTVVRGGTFFPATVMSNENFYDFFGFRIQVIKILVGMVFYYLATTLMRLHNQEQTDYLERLKLEGYTQDMRCKIGYEMHDSVVQDLYGIHLKMKSLALAETEPLVRDIHHALKRSREFMQTQTFKRMSYTRLCEKTQALLDTYQAMSDTLVSFEKVPKETIKEDGPSYLYTQCYFALQEAIINAFKHAQATEISVALSWDEETFVMAVRDNGKGMQSTSQSLKGYGLISMKTRIQSINGTLEIHNLEKGTLLSMRVPLGEVLL